ncbi:RhoGEF domain containing protein [Entamoeba histolytica HM-1:IMSS-B]|uniref:DH domain-containing protein n=6 Tax=Entamoeba histolytica TaxID=5759 RepID=C4M568_ENTH1|nr:hypothetical protein EHI_111560 [Entamoeba histolytica HM-1:IMSS]EMD49047.1 rho/RAC guanine nucleotide exchange factor, putative [Entamoeba histolytica KU27]EMH74952.1 RhoGEF domain containing protein [Entamoeba histolytica HM-1:IMSS-B]ENY64974.1 Rho/RAC guanine nucleotide exchange factor, putative [Entamoeba histolytica HM-1:IMSS-A]GAT96551.1 hypothetical protein CL6EHI_111560 [Entamoeba histolytica]EAL43680.1 hypothetical protein EHI_111560 [Entamoeba histolytica HM-1:IMSS]|eukprot:XP_649062.1 hypothetical protein EHI_111560 [Entamoeba histolytica HM-1:IMSS]
MNRLFIIESPTKRFSFQKKVLDNPQSRGTILFELFGEKRRECNEVIHANLSSNEMKEIALLTEYLSDKPDILVVGDIKDIVMKAGPLLRAGIDIENVMNYYMVDNKLEATRLIVKGMGQELAKCIISRNRSGEKMTFRKMFEEIEKRGKELKGRNSHVIELIRNWSFGTSNNEIKSVEVKKEEKISQRNCESEVMSPRKNSVDAIEIIKPSSSRYFRRKPSDSNSIIPQSIQFSSPDLTSSYNSLTKSTQLSVNTKQLSIKDEGKTIGLMSRTDGIISPMKRSWRKSRIQSAIIDLPKLQQNLHEQSLLSLSSTPNNSCEHITFKSDSNYQKRLDNIIKMESVIRGFLIRRELSINNLLQRKNVLQEIVQTEENLCKNMKLMDKYFRIPLKEMANKGLLNENEVTNVFTMAFDRCLHNSEEISNRFKALYDSLKFDTLIGEGLNESFYLVTSLLVFTTDYNISLKTWKEIKKNKCVIELIENNLKIKELDNRTLEQLLIQPVQRTMRYPMLINELIKATKKVHKDFGLLKKSYDEYHFFSQVVDERTKMRDDLQRLCEILDKPEYFIFGRILIGEYRVELKESKKKNAIVYLCNDIILIRKGKTKEKTVLEEFPLNGNVVADISNRTVTIKQFRNEQYKTFIFETTQNASVFTQIVNGTIMDGWYVLGDDRSYGKLLSSFIK